MSVTNNNKIKIAIICTPLGFKGGTFRHLLNWVNNYEPDKLEIALFCSYSSNDDRTKADNYFRKIKSIKYYSEPWMYPVSNLISGGFLKLYKSIKKFSPDIIHTVFVHADLIGSLLKILTKTPHVSSWEGELVGNLFHNRLKKCVFLFLYRLSNSFVDKYISISKATAIQNGVKYYIDKNKIIIIHSGLTENYIDRKAELVKTNSIPVVGLVSRLTAEKKIDIFIQSMPIIINKIGKVKFWIIGDGDQKNHLVDISREKKVDNCIDFLGWNSDIPAILKKLDIFVFTSLGEGLPWSILEAQAVGVPVIASDVGGVSEAIINDRTGLLVKTNSPEEFASKIIELIEQPHKRNELVKNAKKRICEYFTIERELKDILEVYQDLLID